MVQSNVVLVANGVEDGNNDKIKTARMGLSADKEGYVSIVAVYEPGKETLDGGVTLKEFGDLLVTLGSLHALNLDGGPSAQMTLRKQDGKTTDLVPRVKGDTANEMPLFFVVEK